MRKLTALLLVVAVPAFAEETCAEVRASLPDVPGTSTCLEPGEPAPYRARALSLPEHQRREKVNARNADLWDSVMLGDALVVSKPLFYSLIVGGTAAVFASILLGGLLAALKKP